MMFPDFVKSLYDIKLGITFKLLYLLLINYIYHKTPKVQTFYYSRIEKLVGILL